MRAPPEPRPADVNAQQADARTLLAVQAAWLDQHTLASVGAALARTLKTRLMFDRVGVAVERIGQAQPELVGLSDEAATAAVRERIEAAVLEAIDQRATLLVPETRTGQHPRITLAHRALVDGRSGSVCTVPLVAAGHVIGAICAERDRPIDAADIATLESVAATASPYVALMRLNEQPLHSRLAHLVSKRASLLTAPTHLRLQLGLGAAALALLAAAVVPVDWRIGGHARLEGEFQRVLTAPADGFVQAVHARPGDVVTAGQPLLDLAEQDLQLEKRRWESQRSQFENATVAANARADRAQLVINQSKAAEAQAQLELVDMKLARSRISAPFDGVVIKGDLSQSLGAAVAQGAELITVAPRDRFRVMVEVDERDIDAVAIGQSGTLALSALPWNTLPIRVVRISPIANAVEGRNVFEVEAALLGQPAELRPGLQGSAHIVAGEQPLLRALTHRLTGWVKLAWWEWLG
ncbi:MAG: hypothetical protein JWQ11_3867 [Rhizobacter sp.]|nr:hypothetical protein [Rhizobacter sp.]